MRICIIGSTGHVNYVFDGLKLLPEVELVGIAPGSTGESIERLQAMANRIDRHPQSFTDYRDMLHRLKPDLAVVACFFSDTAQVAAYALRLGCHVFVEKPLATTMEDLTMLRVAFEQSGRQLAGMFGMRYSPAFEAAYRAIRDGAIGQVRLAQLQKSYPLGRRGPHYQRRDVYGGTIPWVGSHAVDLLYWLSGQTFESVFAVQSCRDNRGHGELEMTAQCQFVLSNETIASVSLDYLRPSEAPTAQDDRVRIAGTEGVLEVREDRAYIVGSRAGGAGIVELPPGPRVSIFADFVGQIEYGEACRISAKDSFYVTEICLKARQSADERRIVRLREGQ